MPGSMAMAAPPPEVDDDAVRTPAASAPPEPRSPWLAHVVEVPDLPPIPAYADVGAGERLCVGLVNADVAAAWIEAFSGDAEALGRIDVLRTVCVHACRTPSGRLLFEGGELPEWFLDAGLPTLTSVAMLAIEFNSPGYGEPDDESDPSP